MQMFLVSLILVFVAVAIAQGEGVKCYDCVYPLTSACEKPIGDNVKTCSGKLCTKVHGEKDGKKYIQRACVSHQAAKDECQTAEMSGIKMTVCVCKSDLCNGASFQSVSIVSMVTLVLCAACASRWL